MQIRILWVFLVLLNYQDGINLCKQREYEKGYTLLSNTPDRQVTPEHMPEFFFYRAVAAHQLGKKKEAEKDIDILFTWWFTVPVPKRYIEVSQAMYYDMQNWKTDGLQPISRKMSNIGRRLDLRMAGKETRRQQKEVVVKLDELIKRLENEQKFGKGVGCPGPAKEEKTSKEEFGLPLKDSKLGGVSGKGEVDRKLLKKTAKVWGTLPDKERAKAMVELTRQLPQKQRALIEAYFRELQKGSGKP